MLIWISGNNNNIFDDVREIITIWSKITTEKYEKKII